MAGAVVVLGHVLPIVWVSVNVLRAVVGLPVLVALPGRILQRSQHRLLLRVMLPRHVGRRRLERVVRGIVVTVFPIHLRGGVNWRLIVRMHLLMRWHLLEHML